MAGTRFDVHLLRVFLVRAKDTNRTSTDFCSNDTVTRSRATDFCARARMNVLSVFGVKPLCWREKAKEMTKDRQRREGSRTVTSE